MLISQDAMYHTSCLLTLYRKSSQKSYDNEYDDHDKQIHGQVLAEVANYMEIAASDEKKHVFKLVDLSYMYKYRVRELGEHTPDRVHMTKLKNRLVSHIGNMREFKDKKTPT